MLMEKNFILPAVAIVAIVAIVAFTVNSRGDATIVPQTTVAGAATASSCHCISMDGSSAYVCEDYWVGDVYHTTSRVTMTGDNCDGDTVLAIQVCNYPGPSTEGECWVYDNPNVL